MPIRFLEYSNLGFERWQQSFPSDQKDALIPGLVPVDEAVGPKAQNRFQIVKEVRRPPIHVVGFVEYRRALQHLAALTDQLSTGEIDDLSRLIEADDRFVIHSNLSRVYDEWARQSSLKSLFEPAKHKLSKSRFERRGLAWVAAIAILEVQGIVASEQMIDERISYFDPDVVPDFCKNAYAELLFDATRLAYYGVIGQVQQFVQGGNQVSLAVQWKFQERLALTHQLLTAVIERNRNNPVFKGTRLQELESWSQDVARLRGQAGGVALANRPGVSLEIKGPDPAAIQALRDAIGQAAVEAGQPIPGLGGAVAPAAVP